ncbi:MAG TPA: hypothetical protein VFJ97_02835 [Dermatophilaceae bacterium]|nr:hypothetical protein [Dermatophilaceae bacterium]
MNADEQRARLTEVALETLLVPVRVIRHAVELGRATLAGEGATAGRSYVEAVGQEGERYWRSVSELGRDYANDVIELGAKLTSAMTGQGRPKPFTNPSRAATPRHPERPEPRPFTNPSRAATPQPTEPAEAPETSGREVPVSMSGKLGGRATATATVTNQQARRRKVKLTPSPFATRNGRPIDLVLTVDPPQPTLAPNEELTLTFTADLSAEAVKAGRTYRCQVEATGGDKAVFEVTLNVNA